MTSFEIRKLFLDFFKRRGHKHLPGSSLIPQGDSSLLFVNAGMNQFKSVFLGLAKPPAQNVVTIQKCLRAGGKHNDLENVGQTPRHHTFFEMMGNFSFGGYFKKEALQLSWEFLTNVLRLPPERLWPTVFEEDRETERLWLEEIKIPSHKILKCGEKDNFWRMGDSGPCGPCSEIHYYDGPKKQPSPEDLTEIWNLVFMEFNEDKKGNRTPLPIKCVDTGMGLERLTAIIQNKQSNYHTDLFRGIIQVLEKESGARYDWTEKSQEETQTAFRVLADHSRATAFLMSDGLVPGNEGKYYVLRRIIRRALFYRNKLNPNKNLLKASAREAAAFMGAAYPELLEYIKEAANIPVPPVSNEVKPPAKKNKKAEASINTEKKAKEDDTATDTTDGALGAEGKYGSVSELFDKSGTGRFMDSEDGAFDRSLEEGEKWLFQKMASLPPEKKFMDAFIAWHLYSTYGFLWDSIRLIAKKQGWRMASDEEIELYNYEAFNKSRIGRFIDSEARAFDRSSKAGEKWLFQKMASLPPEKKFIDASTAWHLRSTYGFPKDLTRQDIAKKQGWRMASDEEIELCKQKEQQRFQAGVLSKEHKGLPKKLTLENLRFFHGRQKTILTCYEKEEEESQILQVFSVNLMKEFPSTDPGLGFQETPRTSPSGPLKKDQKGWVILDKTCFYPEGGGPVGDRGELKTKTGKAKVLDCREKGDFILHEVEVTEGEIKAKYPQDHSPLKPDETKCKIKVDPDHRRAIKAGHSATHLLHKALREVLGSDVRQAGSLIDAEKLRFDFTHPKPLTEGQREEIENQVMADIQSQNPVSSSLTSLNEAKKTGALFLAGENYSDQVRVIKMGGSRELCGGIHVKNTSEISFFKIISETGVQSGVRRITAYTGERAKKWLNFLTDQNLQIRDWLNSRTGEFPSLRSATDLVKTNKNPALSKQTGAGQSLSEKTEDNFFILWFQEREREIKQLKNQLRNLIPPKSLSFGKSGKNDKAVGNEGDKNPPVDFDFSGGGSLKSEHPTGGHIKEAVNISNKTRRPVKENKKKHGLSNEESTKKDGPPTAENKHETAYKHINKKMEFHREKAVHEILELQKYLKLPILNELEKNPFIPLMERKTEELKSLKRQVEGFPWETVTGEKLKEPSGAFQFKGIKGWLIVRDLPVTDKKVLADMADQLKLKISSGVVVVFGAGKGAWPVVVTVTRNLQKHISAGDLLKNTITPPLKGKGGGPARFAQGVITDKARFPELEQTLLSALKKKSD